MKTTRIQSLTFAVSLGLVLLSPAVAFAHGQDSHERIEEKKQEITQRVTQQKAVAKERLDAAKRKACERYSKNIVAMMGRITDRRQAQVDHISDVASKTEAFYARKGYVLSNYHALTDDVAAKKAAAEAALAATKSVSQFDCNSEGPKAQLQTFRDARTTAIQAINDYRQSVKALIQGVKAAQNQGVRS